MDSRLVEKGRNGGYVDPKIIEGMYRDMNKFRKAGYEFLERLQSSCIKINKKDISDFKTRMEAISLPEGLTPKNFKSKAKKINDPNPYEKFRQLCTAIEQFDKFVYGKEKYLMVREHRLFWGSYATSDVADVKACLAQSKIVDNETNIQVYRNLKTCIKPMSWSVDVKLELLPTTKHMKEVWKRKQ